MPDENHVWTPEAIQRLADEIGDVLDGRGKISRKVLSDAVDALGFMRNISAEYREMSKALAAANRAKGAMTELAELVEHRQKVIEEASAEIERLRFDLEVEKAAVQGMRAMNDEMRDIVSGVARGFVLINSNLARIPHEMGQEPPRAADPDPDFAEVED